MQKRLFLSLSVVALIGFSTMAYGSWVWYSNDYKTSRPAGLIPNGDCLEMICQYGCVENNEYEGWCCNAGLLGDKCHSNLCCQGELTCSNDTEEGICTCQSNATPYTKLDGTTGCCNNTENKLLTIEGKKLCCPIIDGCETYNEDCTCADCIPNYSRIFDGQGCKKGCENNSDCPSGKFCAFERPNSFSDQGEGWCQEIDEFGKKTFYKDDNGCWVHSIYPMTWWSAQNWCAAQNMNSATKSTQKEVSIALGGTEVWLKDNADSIHGWFMYDGTPSSRAGKSDGFLALCSYRNSCQIQSEELISCENNNDCAKNEFCAFQNGHVIGGTKGPGYCRTISSFIEYPFSVDGKEYVLSGTQMSSWSVTNWCEAQHMKRITARPGQNVLNKLKQEYVGGSVWLTGRCLFFIATGSTDCSAVSLDSFYALCEK